MDDFWGRELNRTYRPRRYRLTLSIRNHNVSEARFFRLVGVDNTVDFHVSPGQIFTNSYQVNRKGAWTLFIEFPGDRYAKSPRKLISRDSFPHWVMEVYSFPPDSVGFSEWHKMHRPKGNRKRGRRRKTRRKEEYFL